MFIPFFLVENIIERSQNKTKSHYSNSLKEVVLQGPSSDVVFLKYWTTEICINKEHVNTAVNDGNTVDNVGRDS